MAAVQSNGNQVVTNRFGTFASRGTRGRPIPFVIRPDDMRRAHHPRPLWNNDIYIPRGTLETAPRFISSCYDIPASIPSDHRVSALFAPTYTCVRAYVCVTYIRILDQFHRSTEGKIVHVIARETNEQRIQGSLIRSIKRDKWYAKYL